MTEVNEFHVAVRQVDDLPAVLTDGYESIVDDLNIEMSLHLNVNRDGRS